jgi:ribosomal protein L9
MVEPIKELGTHTVPAKLHADVEFPVTIEVVTL